MSWRRQGVWDFLFLAANERYKREYSKATVSKRANPSVHLSYPRLYRSFAAKTLFHQHKHGGADERRALTMFCDYVSTDATAPVVGGFETRPLHRLECLGVGRALALLDS